MKKLNKRSIGKNVIKSEISALNLTQSRLDSSFEKACDVILKCTGKVITIGLGKSGYIAAKSAATFSSTGTPALFLHATEALHGDMGVISKKDLIIFFSNSGETKELLTLLPLMKVLKIPVISITGSSQSSLAKGSQITLDSSVKTEACPLNLTPTSSVITALSIADALAITLLECKGFTSKDFAKSHPQGTLGRMLLKRSGNIMHTKNLPLIKHNMDLKKALDIITKCNFGVGIVLNESKKVLGIFTDGDLRRTLKKYSDISLVKIHDVMTKNPLLIFSDILAAEAISLMEENNVTTLIVIDSHNKFEGIVTLNELLKTGLE